MEPNTQIVKSASSKEVEFVPVGSRDPIKLSVAIVRNFIAQKTRSGAEASDADCMKFVMLCKVRGLDPWQGDAYLQGYDSSNGPTFTLITAHQAFLKRAEINKSFDGMQSGVVCTDEDGNLLEYEGDLVLQGHTLVGGWARVFFKNRSRPMFKRLKLASYDKGFSRWKVDPAGMIVKCAEADALRSAFPNTLGGMYLEAELGDPSAAPTIQSRRPVAMPTAIDDHIPDTPPIVIQQRQETVEVEAAPATQAEEMDEAGPIPPPNGKLFADGNPAH